jgi:cobalt-zinc-cadmium efflux system membrane fusion protein
MKILWILPFLLVTGCSRAAAPEAQPAEVEPLSVTDWTERTELFMEYPPLVSGTPARFAVHFTGLADFHALTKGRVTVELRPAAGQPATFQTPGPSSPGVFGVTVTPVTPGSYAMAVSVESPELKDRHELGLVQVYSDASRAAQAPRPPAYESISFLKEQQWSLEFRTTIVRKEQLRISLRVPAEVIPRSGGEAEVTAPFDGRLVVSSPLVIGQQVSQGQVLAQLLPPTSAPSDLAGLQLAKDEATAVLELARKDRERAERLVNAGAAPAKRLDEARTAESNAAARLKAAEARLAQYDISSAAVGDSNGAKLFALRAPITGVIQQVDAPAGANVKAGEILFRIVDLDTVYVSAIVPEAELPRIAALSGAELEVPGSDRPQRLQRLVSVGRVVDPTSRTFPVIYQIDNRDRGVAVNQTVYVNLLTEAAKALPVVPDSAIVDDGGRSIVFVQAAGESFVRKPVRLGIREGGQVQILEGLSAGERVVTRGAHLIRLASMSSQVPAHGHVH